MSVNRRKFLQYSVGGALLGALPTISFATKAKRAGFKAVVFDGFPIFDPRPIPALIESLFPGKGPKIWSVWRTRLGVCGGGPVDRNAGRGADDVVSVA